MMIVGAGVAGCYLGKKIGECEIWEKSKKLMEKACGGLVSKNIKKLDVDLSECIANEVKGSKLFANGETLEIRKNTTQAYVLDRLAFQKTLLEDAENEGCKIEFGKIWKDEEDDYIIGADGALSIVAKSCGIKRRYIHAYQIKTQLPSKCDPDFVELHFGKFAPGFFAWIIPFDEKNVEIGLGCDSGNPKEHFKVFSKGLDFGEIKQEQSALIPLFDPEQKTVFGNKALVGDAAAQVKATSGGGILFGLKCAEVLAEAIDIDDLNFYEAKWRTLYEKDLMNHLRVRNFLNKADLPNLFRTLKEKGVDKLIEEFGDMEHPEALIKEIMKRPSLWGFFGKMFLEI